MRMEWLRASDNFPACWACFLIYETELRSSPSPDRSSASISRCHLMKHARCGLICGECGWHHASEQEVTQHQMQFQERGVSAVCPQSQWSFDPWSARDQT
jgi:hypothetical protein